MALHTPTFPHHPRLHQPISFLATGSDTCFHSLPLPWPCWCTPSLLHSCLPLLLSFASSFPLLRACCGVCVCLVRYFGCCLQTVSLLISLKTRGGLDSLCAFVLARLLARLLPPVLACACVVCARHCSLTSIRIFLFPETRLYRTSIASMIFMVCLCIADW